MKNGLRGILAAALTALLLCFTALPASAAQQAPSQPESAVTAALPGSGNEWISAQLALPDSVSAKRVTAVTRLTKEQVEEISDRLAQHSNIYLVQLQDGRRTYYMAVDFRDDDAVYFSKLVVMRAASQKLLERSEAMAEEESEPKPILMSYTHIIGELSLHYAGYRVTNALGGEKLPGLLGKVYRSCVVADLNIDEGRMAVAIRLAGKLLG